MPGLRARSGPDGCRRGARGASDGQYWQRSCVDACAFPADIVRRPDIVVGDAFAGVGVAASDDPAVDEFIVERLRWAGLNHVRMDFTASDENGPAARLLDRLIAAGCAHHAAPDAGARRSEADARHRCGKPMANLPDPYPSTAMVLPSR